MRLIDAESYIKYCYNRWIPLNVDAVIAQPTVDAVEVVRCKDCKWSVEHYDTDGNVPYWACKNWDGGTDADGYCHEAERKEE